MWIIVIELFKTCSEEKKKKQTKITTQHKSRIFSRMFTNGEKMTFDMSYANEHTCVIKTRQIYYNKWQLEEGKGCKKTT